MTKLINERIADLDEGWYLDVEMKYTEENGPCHLKIVSVSPERNISIPRIDDDFQNHVKMSAFLSSELTSYVARQFLYHHNIPKESLLWSLNHDGWADMSNQPPLKLEHKPEEKLGM